MNLIKFNSYPKINLFLLIKKYNKKTKLHKLKSLFYLVKDNIFDEVTISVSNNNFDSINYFDKNDKKIEVQNCIFIKTINLLKEQKIIDSKLFFDINVLKRIPISSGVGGGSSNVACFFKYLLITQKVKFNKTLKNIILKVGSDVMFFVKGYELAKVWNYGEKVKKVKLKKKLKIKLFFNDIKCDTKKVFEYYDNNVNRKINVKNNYLNQFLYFKINKSNLLKNDLETSSLKIYSDLVLEMNKIKEKYNKKIHLSGSGGTFFLIFD